jgi:hypothetical protein
MVPTFKSKTLLTDLYSMNPPHSRGVLLFYHPIFLLSSSLGGRDLEAKYVELSIVLILYIRESIIYICLWREILVSWGRTCLATINKS